jgi:hypothetical protein
MREFLISFAGLFFPIPVKGGGKFTTISIGGVPFGWVIAVIALAIALIVKYI